MKILHLCLGAFFIDNYSYQENMLPKYHVKQGNEVTVITSLFSFNKDGLGGYFSKPSHYRDNNGFEVIRLSNKKPVRLNRFLRRFEGLGKTIQSVSPDIIFVHNTTFGDTPVVRDYLKKNPDVKLFVDCHADYINSAKNWLSKHVLHPIIWRHYTKVLEPYMVRCYGVTPMRCRFLKDMYHVNQELIEYLPLGVDDDLIPDNRKEVRRQVRQGLHMNEDDFLVFTGGKIDRLKNTHLLIDALRQLNNRNLHLVICGVLTPQMEYLQEQIEANANIHYLGWCDAERVMNCMVASDLACFPGTHSTLWEQSVGVGLPAIFKRWPEMEHVNVNGNCLFVENDSVQELSDTITYFMNPANYAIKKAKAQEAAKRFLYSEIAKKAIEIK